MARGGERETSAQQTRANAARDGKCNSEGAVRKGRRIARRYQSAQSQRANGRETEKLNLRWQDHRTTGGSASRRLDCAGKAKRRRRFSRVLTFSQKEKRCGAALPAALQKNAALSPQAKLVVADRWGVNVSRLVVSRSCRPTDKTATRIRWICGSNL